MPAPLPWLPWLDTALVRAFLDDRHLALAPEVEELARRELAPRLEPASDGAARQEARRLLELLGAAGWIGWALPQAHGGHRPEPDLRACCLIREALAAASPLADAVFALQCLGSLPLSLAGSAAQRERWLPEVAAGRAMAAFAMTEPEAGSDVSALATVARREDGGYVLDGAKTLISNAGIADYYLVFAAIEPPAGEPAAGDRVAGRRAISCFLVAAATPGLRFAGAQVLSSPHPLGELAFADCRVTEASRVGAEGEGFKLGMRTLDRLRPTVAAAACGMAARALAEARSHALERRQFGQRLADFQLVQAKLAVMATDLAAARLLVYRAAWEVDHGADRVSVPAAMAKAFATEAAQRIVDAALQILGGRGALAESPVERLYRSVRALRIYEGTTEIQHLVIARHLLREAEGR